MRRKILSTITALTMVMSVGCSSASALTPNLSTKTNQWQTATPVSSEYDLEDMKLIFSEEQMKAKYAKDFNKKVEEIKVLDANKIEERFEMTPGITVARTGGKQVKINKSDILKHDIIKLGENYFYNFKNVTIDGKEYFSVTVLPLSGGSGVDAKYESGRPMAYQINKDGRALFQNPINHKVDNIIPVISECWLVTGTEYKLYVPTTNAIIRNVVDFNYTISKPGDHVASMQIID